MDVFIAGVGMTVFGEHPGKSVRDLAAAAITDALADADCAISSIEGVWFANTGQGALKVST